MRLAPALDYRCCEMEHVDHASAAPSPRAKEERRKLLAEGAAARRPRAETVKVIQGLRDRQFSRAEIAFVTGLSPKTISTYTGDPEGEQIKKLRVSYRGVCTFPGCENPTTGDAPGKARKFCAEHRGESLRRWSKELVLDRMHEWKQATGSLPTSPMWNTTHSQRLGGQVADLYATGRFPSATTVIDLFGGFAEAHEAYPQHKYVKGRPRPNAG